MAEARTQEPAGSAPLLDLVQEEGLAAVVA